jgi:hypothetical protein
MCVLRNKNKISGEYFYEVFCHIISIWMINFPLNLGKLI